jgi:hypothetical protein
MKGLRVKLAIGVAAVGVAVTAAGAVAGSHNRLETTLTGYEEVPAISTGGHGTFRAAITDGGSAIRYELLYDRLSAPVQQAHILFGQKAVSGGISAFLCTNLGNGPAGTQACPQPPARVTGTIRAADVVGPNGQGIAPGELPELIAALRAGVAYANVHSSLYPAGEIRGQIEDDRGHR